jgi:superfamily II DNA or RNA helicase
MLNYDHAACTECATNLAPNDHESCTDCDTSCERIHSHSQRSTKAPSQERSLSAALTLRPYQSRAIENLRSGLGGGAARLMLYSPTGSGKPEIGMTLVKVAMVKRRRVAFLCRGTRNVRR